MVLGRYASVKSQRLAACFWVRKGRRDLDLHHLVHFLKSLCLFLLCRSRLCFYAYSYACTREHIDQFVDAETADFTGTLILRLPGESL